MAVAASLLNTSPRSKNARQDPTVISRDAACMPLRCMLTEKGSHN